MKLLFSLLLTFGVFNTYAQTPEENAVKQTIDQLFSAMRSHDTSVLAKLFSPTAVLQTIVAQKEGGWKVRTDEVSAFVQAVGRPSKDILDERITYGTILIDGPLASVWTPYKFYLGERFSHCGVNSFQLVKLNGEWKIQYLIDTRRKEPCP